MERGRLDMSGCLIFMSLTFLVLEEEKPPHGYAGTRRREQRKAPERLPEQQEPQGSCGSLVDPPVPGSVKDPGAPARRGMVRPAAEGESARGDQSGRKPRRRFGNGVLRRGSRESWDHGHGTRAGGLKCFGACGACDLVFLRVRG